MGELLHIRRDHATSLYPDLDMDCRTCGGKKTSICYYDHHTCKRCGSMSDMYRGQDIMAYRHKTKRSRKQFAPLLGLSPRTLKSYEWKRCSGVAFDRFKKLIRKELSNE